MQSWEGIKSLTLSSGIGKAKSTHTNTWWKYSGADTYKTDAIIIRGACLCAGLIAAMSAQLRRAVATPTVPARRPGLLHLSEPLRYPTFGDPLPPVSHRGESIEGRTRRAARWVPADHPRHPQQSPAAGWKSALLNPGHSELGRRVGTSGSQGVFLPRLLCSDEDGVGCRGWRQSWRCWEG